MTQSSSSLVPIKIFISYSQKDDELRKELEDVHLSALRQQGKIQSWSKSAISPGEEWEKATQQAFDSAQIILLLISSDFIAADSCNTNEMERALERHNKGSAKVIPIFLRPTFIEGAPFEGIQSLPTNAQPITKWQDRDDAFVDIVKGISQTIDSLQIQKGPATQLKEVNIGLESTKKETSFDDLVQKTQKLCRQKILNQHSYMRLLSGKEVRVDQLYVDVWLLDKPEQKYFNSPENLLSSFDIANDRLALSKRLRRNPGFEIANTNSMLVILGKPGSGKTTFLKHLAVDWLNGKFHKERITVLIEFREIQDNKWNLLNIIDQLLEFNSWHQLVSLEGEINDLKSRINELEQQKNNLKSRINELEQQKNNLKSQINELEKQKANFQLKAKEKSLNINELEKKIENLKNQLESLPLFRSLVQGKLLILMDGLDEVPTNQLRLNIQDQLTIIAKKYPKNRFILTCRTQIVGVIPTGFTLVEIADFNSEQVRKFVQNWFVTNNRSEKTAEEQWKKVNLAAANQPEFKELTVTPVLLSLICLVLQDEGELPTDRAWLYRKGIRLLLSRWNDEKQIDGWEVGTETYCQLCIEDKEALLLEIAAQKFENPENFVLFRQEELAKQIIQKLKLVNLQEGVSVLRAIETQHGLLIERADELWSFSHLTFQEYFTVQWLTQLSSKQLAQKITNQHWQKIVEQLVKSQQPADQLLRLIKQAIDQSIADESTVQTFLKWLIQKSETVSTDCRMEAIRAFYYSFCHDLDFASALSLGLNLNAAINLNLIGPFDKDTSQDNNHSYKCGNDLAQAATLTPSLLNAPKISYCLLRLFFSLAIVFGTLYIPISGIIVINHQSFLTLFQVLTGKSFSLILICTLTTFGIVSVSHNLSLSNHVRAVFSILSINLKNSDRDLVIDLALDLSLDCARTLVFALTDNRTIALNRKLNRTITLILALNLNIHSDLRGDLLQLKKELPRSGKGIDVQKWWQAYGARWITKFHELMVKHRNIGHDWHSTNVNQRYYNSNKFLIELMNIPGAVSEDARTKIEGELLLPWAELQRRNPERYGEPE